MFVVLLSLCGAVYTTLVETAAGWVDKPMSEANLISVTHITDIFY